MLVGGVLPEWLDAMLEEVVVGVPLQLTRRENVVIQTPKVLHLRNSMC